MRSGAVRVPSVDVDALVAEIERLRERVDYLENRALAQLEQRVAQLEATIQPRQPRHAHDRRLLLAIAAAVGDTVFNSAELFAHRLVDEALGVALAGASIRTAQQTGKALKRLSRRPGAPGEPRIERLSRDAHGVLWCVSWM